MALFFLPFIFVGGLNGLMQYIKILLFIKDRIIPRWTSISCITMALFKTFFLSVSDKTIISTCTIISNIYLIINIISFYKTKSKYTEYILLISIFCLYVPDSYRYVAIYMVIPFVWILKEDKLNKIDLINYVLLMLIFAIPIWNTKRTLDLLIFIPIYLVNMVSYIKVWILKE